jgi:hypothetical protein
VFTWHSLEDKFIRNIPYTQRQSIPEADTGDDKRIGEVFGIVNGSLKHYSFIPFISSTSLAHLQQ